MPAAVREQQLADAATKAEAVRRAKRAADRGSIGRSSAGALDAAATQAIRPANSESARHAAASPRRSQRVARHASGVTRAMAALDNPRVARRNCQSRSKSGRGDSSEQHPPLSGSASFCIVHGAAHITHKMVTREMA